MFIVVGLIFLRGKNQANIQTPGGVNFLLRLGDSMIRIITYQIS